MTNAEVDKQALLIYWAKKRNFALKYFLVCFVMGFAFFFMYKPMFYLVALAFLPIFCRFLIIWHCVKIRHDVPDWEGAREEYIEIQQALWSAQR